MKYKIGQVLEDGYIYAGEMINHETGEVYVLAVAPKDEPGTMSWHEAIKLPIPTSKEGNLISANLGHLFAGEWIMGYDIGHTKLNALGTQWFQCKSGKRLKN